MATIIDTLGFAVDSSQIRTADKDLTKLNSTSKKTSKASDSLSTSFRSLLAPLAGIVSATAALNKLVDVGRQFDVLNAGLVTATGSAEDAEKAFGALERFASETPFLLDQSVEGFTRLVNLGLTPSERALRSYGDTASAMGKDLTQLIEAVADAATGEFERLKEFGIKARNEGETIKFTFRGVETEVANNAAAIEQHLIELGEVNFAGAMLNRMKTLDGALSNLEDEWDKVFRGILQSGAGDILESQVRKGIDALQELNQIITSGQLVAALDLLSNKFEVFEQDGARAFDIVSQLYSQLTSNIEIESEGLTQDLLSAFENMPENIRAFIQIMTVELASFVDRTSAYGKEILENLQFWKDEEFDLEQALETIDEARLSSIDSILTEREKLINSYEVEKKGVRDLGESYRQLKKDQEQLGTEEPADQLAGFAVQDKLASAVEKTNEELERQEDLADGVGESFGDAFADIALGAGETRDIIQALGDDIARLILQQSVSQPIAGAIATGVGSIFAGDSANVESFDNGGFTGLGPRTGGIDGKGGFPAILHPNETVIDHTKGQSAAGTTIQQNFTIDARGAEQGMEERLRIVVAEAAQKGYEAVAHDVATNGPIRRSFG